MAVWCVRCAHAFRTPHARNQHIRDSVNHHKCPACDFDGASWDDLLEHCRNEGCRTVCRDCDNGVGMHWVAQSNEYLEHVDKFNVCTECERHFTSPGRLHQHRLSHRKPKHECYKCTNMFKTYGGMIIHLEYGTCGNIDHTDLNKLAAKCNRWNCFIDEEYRDELLKDGDTECNVNPFMCPTCDAALPKLSSLFQHVESDACAQTLDEGAVRQLRRFLRSRLR